MIRAVADLAWQPKLAIRGGEGPAASADLLKAGDMDGVLGAGLTRLEPGSSVGEHAHPNTEELYLVVSGHGTGVLDGQRFPMGPGDCFLTKAGHSHGIQNDGNEPLIFFGLLTRQA